MMQTSLGLKLRVLRAEHGWSLRQAAARAGVVKETISDLERNRTHALDVTLAKLAKAYKVPLEELLEAQAGAAGGDSPLAEAEAPPWPVGTATVVVLALRREVRDCVRRAEELGREIEDELLPSDDYLRWGVRAGRVLELVAEVGARLGTRRWLVGPLAEAGEELPGPEHEAFADLETEYTRLVKQMQHIVNRVRDEWKADDEIRAALAGLEAELGSRSA